LAEPSVIDYVEAKGDAEADERSGLTSVQLQVMDGDESSKKAQT
jgi:hypothetical protein